MGPMLVVRDAGVSIDAVPAGVQQVLSHWRGPDRPHISVQTLEKVLADASILDGVDSVWILLRCLLLESQETRRH